MLYLRIIGKFKAIIISSSCDIELIANKQIFHRLTNKVGEFVHIEYVYIISFVKYNATLKCAKVSCTRKTVKQNFFYFIKMQCAAKQCLLGFVRAVCF